MTTDNYSYTHKVKSIAYGPTVTDRRVAYGPEVTAGVAYGLTSRESAMKAVA